MPNLPKRTRDIIPSLEDNLSVTKSVSDALEKVDILIDSGSLISQSFDYSKVYVEFGSWASLVNSSKVKFSD